MARPITFLSDYGSTDEFAGVCRAVIARIAPEARVIDLGTASPATTSARARRCWRTPSATRPPACTWPWWTRASAPPRRAVAVAAAQEDRHFRRPGQRPALAGRSTASGAPPRPSRPTRPRRLEPVSPTFHGRDLFAPVAARLALGDPLADHGESIDPGSLERVDRGRPAVADGEGLEAEVGHVDAFGNVSLIATAADADDAGLAPGKRLSVVGPRRSEEATYALTFADAEPGAIVLLVDSARSLALAVNRGDAARALELERGDRVVLAPV